MLRIKGDRFVAMAEQLVAWNVAELSGEAANTRDLSYRPTCRLWHFDYGSTVTMKHLKNMAGARWNIRKLKPSDLEGVRQLLRETWSDTYADSGMLNALHQLLENKDLYFMLPNAGEQAWIATADERPIGILVLRCVRMTHQIISFYILPQYQRRGLGRTLLQHALSSQHTPITIETRVLETSRAAVNFYHAFGFIHTGRQKQMTSLRGEYTTDVLVMRLEIPE